MDRKNRTYEKGSITVFFALLLTLVAAIIITSVESARCRALSYFTAQAQESSLESVFAGYCRPLWEMYHLFFMADGPGLVSDMEDYLASYEGDGFLGFRVGETEILTLETAVDHGGEAFLDEICEDMKTHGKEALLSQLSVSEDQINEAFIVSDYIGQLSSYNKTVGEIEEQYALMEKQGEQLRDAYDKLEEAAGTAAMGEASGETMVKELQSLAEEVRVQSEETHEEIMKLADGLGISVREEEAALKAAKEAVGEQSGAYMEEALADLMEYTEDDGSRRTAAENLKEGLKESAEGLEELLGEVSEEQKAQNSQEVPDGQEAADMEGSGAGGSHLLEKIRQGKEALNTLLPAQKDSAQREKSSLLDCLKDWKNDMLLGLVLENTGTVSEAALEAEAYPSEVVPLESGDSSLEGTALEAAGKKGLAALYMTEHFGNYGNEKKDTVLSYEAEYILGSSKSDKDNLSSAAGKLLALRSGMDFLYLLGDEEKNLEAEALAASLVGFTGIVPLIRLTAKLILGAWAFAEAVNDVKRLLAGKEVPFVKTDEDWRISLAGAADVLTGKTDDRENENGSSQDNSWKYERYLQLMFLFGDTERQLFRMMDVIQSNLRQKDQGFFMENCIYYSQVETSFYAGKYIFYKNAAYGYQ